MSKEIKNLAFENGIKGNSSDDALLRLRKFDFFLKAEKLRSAPLSIFGASGLKKFTRIRCRKSHQRLWNSTTFCRFREKESKKILCFETPKLHTLGAALKLWKLNNRYNLFFKWKHLPLKRYNKKSYKRLTFRFYRLFNFLTFNKIQKLGALPFWTFLRNYKATLVVLTQKMQIMSLGIKIRKKIVFSDSFLPIAREHIELERSFLCH